MLLDLLVVAVRVLVFWPLLNLLPGFAVYSFFKDKKLDSFEVLPMAMIVSPVIYCLICAVVGLTGVPVTLSAMATMALSGLIFLNRQKEFSRKIANPSREAVTAAILASELCLLFFSPLVFNPALRLRADVFLHAPIAYSIIYNGVPPTSPFVSGQHLFYYWTYDLFGGLMSAFTGLDVVTSLFVFNVSSFFSMIFAVWLLARTLGGKYGEGLVSALFLVLSLNALGGWKLIWELIAGSRGVESINSVGNVVIALQGWHSSSILTIFLSTNSSSATMPASIAALYCLNKYRVRKGSYPRQQYLPLLFLSLLASVSYHPPIGVYILPVMFSVAAYDFFTGNREDAKNLFVTIAAAGVLLAYYGMDISYGSPYVGPKYFRSPYIGLASLASALANQLFLAAAFALVGAYYLRSRMGMTLALSLVFFCFALVLVNTPGGNTKTVILIMIPVSVLASFGFWRVLSLLKAKIHGQAVVTLMIVVLIPTNALILYVYFFSQAYLPLSDATDSAFKQIAKMTKPDGVFILPTARLYPPLLYHGRWLTYAEFPPLDSVHTLGYNMTLLHERQRIIDEIYAGKDINANVKAICETTTNTPYIIVGPQQTKDYYLIDAFRNVKNLKVMKVGEKTKYGLIEIVCER